LASNRATAASASATSAATSPSQADGPPDEGIRKIRFVIAGGALSTGQLEGDLAAPATLHNVGHGSPYPSFLYNVEC
jgi:hypothetical protein